MSTKTVRFPFLSFVVLLLFPAISYCSNNHDHNPRQAFIENKGQWNDEVLFRANLPVYSVFLEEKGFTYLLGHPEDMADMHDVLNLPKEEKNQKFIRAHSLKIAFDGAQTSDISAREKESFYYNYFIGNNPDKWASNVGIFHHVQYDDIYPGVDLIAAISSSGFKYDLVLEPGADPDQIQLSYSGQDYLEVKDGKLLIGTSVGEMVENIPLAYQVINNERKIINCEYKLTGTKIGFHFPQEYDPAFPVVIDPVVVAATLSGTTGFSSNFGHGAAYDIEGNIFTHAISFDSEYPVTPGAFQISYGGGGTDIAISKLNPTGTDLIYATFIGGNLDDAPYSTITDLESDLFIYGTTDSHDFPVSDNAYQPDIAGSRDIIVFHLSADGTEMVGSTYLGGSNTDGNNNALGSGYDVLRGEIMVDSQSNVYIASCTASDDFPVTSNAIKQDLDGDQDGLALKLNSQLSELIWSTYVGGSQSDVVYGLRIVPDYGVFLVGGTNSDDLPTTEGAFQEEIQGSNDAFVMAINLDGSEIISSTYVGTSMSEQGYFIDVDNDYNPWIYGVTNGEWFTTQGVFAQDNGTLFITQLTQDLSEINTSTAIGEGGFFGGAGSPVAFMVDRCDKVYISAYNADSNLPITEDAVIQSGGFYLAALGEELSVLEFGTFYTGSHVDGGTSRFDKKGIVYQGVCSGNGEFTTNQDAFAPTQTSGWDIAVFKIDFELSGVNAAITAPGQMVGCIPHTVNFENYSIGDTFEWDFGDGSEGSTEFEPEHTFTEPGEYLVQLISSDSLSCNLADTTYLNIIVGTPLDMVPDFTYTYDCESGVVTTENLSESFGPVEYAWEMGDGSSYTSENVTHQYDVSGEYTIELIITDIGCNNSETHTEEITVLPHVSAFPGFEILDICDSFEILFVDHGLFGEGYLWNFGDGVTISSGDSVIHVYPQPGDYTLELIVSNENSCNLLDTATINFNIPAPPVLNPDFTIQQTGTCSSMAFEASGNPGGDWSTAVWLLQDLPVANGLSAEGVVAEPGEYLITFTVTDPVCEVPFSSTQTFEFIQDLGVSLESDIPFCYYDSLVVLDASGVYEEAEYTWSPVDFSGPALEVTTPGFYEVTVTLNGCSENYFMNVFSGPHISTGYTDSICEGFQNTVFINSDGSNYLWEDGHDEAQINLTSAGVYNYSFVDPAGCIQQDSIILVAKDNDPDLIIPNVFTPNGDGKNDVYQPAGEELKFYRLEVLNRWGKEIFNTEEIYGAWDGKINGNELASPGTYFYIVSYQSECQHQPVKKAGAVSVLN